MVVSLKTMCGSNGVGLFDVLPLRTLAAVRIAVALAVVEAVA